MIFVILNLIFGLLVIQLVWALTNPRAGKKYFVYFKHQGFSNMHLLQIILIACQIISGVFFPWSVGNLNYLVSIVGLGIFYIGIFLAIWAKLVMKKSWGIPGEHDITTQDKLITSGPFAFSRNPIYLGLLLLYFGLSLALRSYFIFMTLILVVHFQQAIKREEEHLQEHFGATYKAYLKKIPQYI